MAQADNNKTRLDANQVIKRVFDEPTESLRTNVQAVISDVSINVDTDATQDSIAIGDADTGDTVLVNPDGSINVNLDVEKDFGDSTEALRVAAQLADATGNEITSSATNNGSPNRLIHSQTPDTAVLPVPLNVLNASVVISLEGLNSVGFQINAGTLTGTIVAEASIDGGLNWAQVPFYDPANSAVLLALSYNNPNATRAYSIIALGGSSHVRVRISAYTSGSATGLLRASTTAGNSGAITAAAFGVVNNTYPTLDSNVPTLVLSANVNRKYAYISNNSGSTVKLQFGNGTGLSGTSGLAVPANSFYEIKGENLFTGEIWLLCGTTVVVSVSEGYPG